MQVREFMPTVIRAVNIYENHSQQDPAVSGQLRFNTHLQTQASRLHK